MKLNKKSIMPYGAHFGKLMSQVPASYLMFMFERGLCEPNVKEYIKSNIDEIKEKAKKEEEIKNQ